MPDAEHHARAVPSVKCAVLTVSDTRTQATDKSGALIAERITGSGHQVAAHVIVHDDADAIQRQVRAFCNAGCEAVIVTGGTGISARDVTFEALLPLLEKKLDGFAELFRQLGYAEIGPMAMLSRAVAGTLGNSIIFSLPGTVAAVQLAMDRVILPVLPHAVSLLKS